MDQRGSRRTNATRVLRAWALVGLCVLGATLLTDRPAEAEGTLPHRLVVAAVARDNPVAPAVYVALGDSLAAGRGASRPAVTGYVPLFRDFLRSGGCATPCLALGVENLGIAGATSADLVAVQLPRALALLASESVAAVTVDIGADDGFAQIDACRDGVSPTCLATARAVLRDFQVNFDTILSRLREAAPTTPILTMTYYNPLVGDPVSCPLAGLYPLAQLFLEGGVGIDQGLNDIIRAAAAAHGVLVAETYGLLDAADIDADCVHPDDSGYAKIAGALRAAWPLR